MVDRSLRYTQPDHSVEEPAFGGHDWPLRRRGQGRTRSNGGGPEVASCQDRPVTLENEFSEGTLTKAGLLSVKRWLNLRTIFQSSNSPRCWSSAAAVCQDRPVTLENDLPEGGFESRVAERKAMVEPTHDLPFQQQAQVLSPPQQQRLLRAAPGSSFCIHLPLSRVRTRTVSSRNATYGLTTSYCSSRDRSLRMFKARRMPAAIPSILIAMP